MIVHNDSNSLYGSLFRNNSAELFIDSTFLSQVTRKCIIEHLLTLWSTHTLIVTTVTAGTLYRRSSNWDLKAASGNEGLGSSLHSEAPVVK
jgi:hypothetical protein